MKERPIGFKPILIPGILADQKSMTRRTNGLERMNEEPNAWRPYIGDYYIDKKGRLCQKFFNEKGYSDHAMCPYGKVGDRLWVRETYLYCLHDDFLEGLNSRFVFRASIHEDWFKALKKEHPSYKWSPAIHMPKYASRILLEITSIRVERLKDISKQDAINEGIDIQYDPADPFTPLTYFYPCNDLRDDTYFQNDPVLSFYSLWTSINGKGSWDKNPWVWVITFKRIKP